MFGYSPPGFRNVGYGVLREYALVKYDHMLKVPDNISLKDASCFPATGNNYYYSFRIIYILLCFSNF